MKTIPAIVIADEQYLTAAGLQLLFAESKDFEVSAMVQSTYELEKYMQNNTPDLLIIDISIFHHKGIQYLEQFRKDYPHSVIIVLSNNMGRNEIENLSKAGIKNILYKTAGKQEIFDALSAAIQGKKYYSPEIVDLLLEMNEKKDSTNNTVLLTPAEKDIVIYITRGLTTKEIAGAKNLSVHTVMTHRKNIFRKLAINNVSELMMYAMKNGLIDSIDYYI
jgi:DNA-binding NarL/FixJ family response regulator